MTNIIIAIGVWCMNSPMQFAKSRDYGQAQSECQKAALQCMAEKKFDEKALPGCLGANEVKKP